MRSPKSSPCWPVDGAVTTAIFNETSYNAIIRDNLIRRNNLVGARQLTMFDLAAITGGRSLCGRMAVISNFGTEPRWSPNQGDCVQRASTFEQQNSWHHNTYVGRSNFTTFDPERPGGTGRVPVGALTTMTERMSST
jgi:hypothetical protein